VIRFIDCTAGYWALGYEGQGDACCAFTDTLTDTFVTSESGYQIFDDLDEVAELGKRFIELVPKGFFTDD